ncbi:MAG: 50S ribosomal protein L11 methyltransferase [Prevotella sp.]|nr:50S ribosomal protein L11 methyltransferase [Prevotella sp.]
MKYYEVKFEISPFSSDACDLLAALAGEVGFESFEETATGLLGYIQQTDYNEKALNEALEDFPMSEVTISYQANEAEDRDWNEQWEQEGFEPIIVGNRLIIHDGRHLPEQLSSASCQLSIEIDAHQAFGTGTHETTRMICATLLDMDLKGKRVLDCGTGTGILSICALKLGAALAIGYDIDEWSVDNARHNAVINGVDTQFQSLLGDAQLLNKVEGTFDVVMANINRNILLNDMNAYCQKMTPDSMLILSGFYTADIPLLLNKAATLGLTMKVQKEDNDWACILLTTC